MDKDTLELVKQLSASYFVSRALHAVAELGVADSVGEAGTEIGLLARATSANEDALARTLRLLSAYGVFEVHETSVKHTPASRLLCSAHPASLRDFARMYGLPAFWRSAEGLLHSLRTGEAAAPRMLSEGGFWEYLAQHPQEARVFDAAMASKASGQISAILGAHDFSQYRTVADIGGGQGHLLRAVLAAHPTMTGILFDLPHVLEATRSAGGSHERLAFHAGSFFSDDLPRCDGYLLMEVLHDWDDASARQILSGVRKSAPSHSRLLVIEAVLPAHSGPSRAKILDVVMLGLFGGRQRTAVEYSELLREGGFELLGETDTGAGISIFEAVPT